MAVILIFLALIIAFSGFLNLNQATLGAGLFALACFLGILARIAQADKQQKEIKEILLRLK